jgi:hypothetical protein
MSAALVLVYWFELWGVPVGVVTLRRADAEYEYRSRLVFTREADRTSVQRGAKLRVDGSGRLASGEVPESLWLSLRPAALGCQKVVEELGGRTGDSCVLRRDGDVDEGTVLGSRYRARYAKGVMRELQIGESRFVMLEGKDARAPAPPDLFSGGLPVSGGQGALRMVPATGAPLLAQLSPHWTNEEAQLVAEEVHGRFAEKLPSAADFGGEEDSAGCLGHARAFVAAAKARGKSVAIVQGLLVLPGEDRAFPHVWVRVRLQGGKTLDLDPTSMDDVTPQTHLALAAGGRTEEAGALWLRVLRGGHKVVRGP